MSASSRSWAAAFRAANLYKEWYLAVNWKATLPESSMQRSRSHPLLSYYGKSSGAKVTVFTSAPNVAQTETNATTLLENADKCSTSLAAKNNNFKGYVLLHPIILLIHRNLALHYLNRFKIAAPKILFKFDLCCRARVINAAPLARIDAPILEEVGYIDIIETTEIRGDRVTVLPQLAPGEDEYKRQKMHTAMIVLKEQLPATFDHAIDDHANTNVIKSIIKDPHCATEQGFGKRIEACRIQERDDFADSDPQIH
ncbi:hypothetical protein EDD22DRAFT_960564 [Suillus occidentalis]|nr:hypothetical protein EDD22DRAFT_960564 [Suillus occidentalis]